MLCTEFSISAYLMSVHDKKMGKGVSLTIWGWGHMGEIEMVILWGIAKTPPTLLASFAAFGVSFFFCGEMDFLLSLRFFFRNLLILPLSTLFFFSVHFWFGEEIVEILESEQREEDGGVECRRRKRRGWRYR